MRKYKSRLFCLFNNFSLFSSVLNHLFYISVFKRENPIGQGLDGGYTASASLCKWENVGQIISAVWILLLFLVYDAAGIFSRFICHNNVSATWRSFCSSTDFSLISWQERLGCHRSFLDKKNKEIRITQPVPAPPPHQFAQSWSLFGHKNSLCCPPPPFPVLVIVVNSNSVHLLHSTF